MTTKQPANDLRPLVQQVRALPGSLKKELYKQTVPGSPLEHVETVDANCAALLQAMPVLTEAEAYGLLAPTESKSRCNKVALVAKLLPFMDQHHQQLEPQLARLLTIVGDFGSHVLDTTLRQVNKARRARGAAEVALLDAVLQIHQTEMALAIKNGDLKPEEGSSNDPRLLDSYQQALTAFLAEAGASAEMVVLGDMTARDLVYLKEIKQWIRTNRPELADPARGDAARFYGLAGQLLAQSRRIGMGPVTRAKAATMKAERRQQPNVLFSPIDGRGAPMWGGRYPNVRRTVTTTKAVPEQGPKRQSSHKVLTVDGDRAMARWEMENRFSYGQAAGGPSAQAFGSARENQLNQLLATDESEGLWRWTFTLEELGFNVVEQETTTEGPDHAWGGEFGGLKIEELVQQMQTFHQRKGFDNAANTFHQVP